MDQLDCLFNWVARATYWIIQPGYPYNKVLGPITIRLNSDLLFAQGCREGLWLEPTSAGVMCKLRILCLKLLDFLPPSSDHSDYAQILYQCPHPTVFNYTCRDVLSSVATFLEPEKAAEFRTLLQFLPPPPPLTIAMDTISVPPEAASMNPGAFGVAEYGATVSGLSALSIPGSFSAALSLTVSNPADFVAFGTSNSSGSFAVRSPASNLVGSTDVVVVPSVDSSGGVRASRKRKRDESGFKAHIGMHAPAYGEEPYYRPEKFVPEDEVFNSVQDCLDLLKKHQHHWNFKMQGTGKGKEVRLWCGDVAPSVPGLQRRAAADSEVPSGLGQCCWEARTVPNDAGSTSLNTVRTISRFTNLRSLSLRPL